jgi:Zn-dependent protease with chaperone function
MEDQLRQSFSLDSLLMYAMTLVAEAPVIIARVFVIFFIIGSASILKGQSFGSFEDWMQLALLPSLWSVLALATPIGTGWWWKQRMGGREPSGREQLAYQDAVELLHGQRSGPLPLPDNWFVLDSPQPDAAACGNTLMLSRGLLETDHLPAVLAHELGHLATPDGRLTAAVNRLVLWTGRARQEHREARPLSEEPFILVLQLIARFIGRTLAAIRGGFGLWLTGPVWGRYWRGREYLADGYAASLGQADELADFLEVHALIHDHPVPFIWPTEHTHPPTELRIDRLRTAAVAPGSEPVKVAPSGPPSAGPGGPTLTEPDPSAFRSMRWAGHTLPTLRGHRR